MNILFIAPTALPYNEHTRYTGIERLVYEYTRELNTRGFKVTVIGHPDSNFPHGIVHLPAYDETKAFQEYSSLYRNFNIIHDFSHAHLASRFIPNLPSLNIFWHAPRLARYPKSPYNIIAASKWAAREFQAVYGHPAKYMQIIAIDPKVYYSTGKQRNNRFLTLGIMQEHKGNLLVAQLCKKLLVPLDIAGSRGAFTKDREPLTPYEEQIMACCDGKRIKFLGEVHENKKLELLKSNAALLYITNHPEVTAHKVQEALMCGMPVLAPDIGSMSEWIEQGVDGFRCKKIEDYVEGIKRLGGLKCNQIAERAKKVYDVRVVIDEHLKLYKEVSEGLRW